MAVSKIPPTLTRGKARLWEGSIPGTHEPGYVELPIIEIGIPPEVHRLVHGDLDLELHRFRFGSCTIMLLSKEPLASLVERIQVLFRPVAS